MSKRKSKTVETAKAKPGCAATHGYERTSKSKPISLSEARKIFAAVAPDVKTCEAYACKSLERTRYWNWFRIGIDAAQKGRVNKSDAQWVSGSPRLKAHNDAGERPRT